MADQTFEEFVDLIQEMRGTYPEWREGQAAFNTLRRYRPDLSEQVRATNIDPFHQTQKLPEFYEWVKANW